TAASAIALRRGSGVGLGRAGLNLLSGGNGGGNGELVPPDDRRCFAIARDLDLPADVAVLVPRGGRVCVRSDAVGQRSSPLGPRCFSRSGWRTQSAQQ